MIIPTVFAIAPASGWRFPVTWAKITSIQEETMKKAETIAIAPASGWRFPVTWAKITSIQEETMIIPTVFALSSTDAIVMPWAPRVCTSFDIVPFLTG
eukprot:CAMPEP_0171788186 /NCGR_PEP_ID=MMETSP0991-20121206/64348_1 /TAXON_ID=483369 /ORGANISM="non described non described, Strain CCMP2098" /LENGTH=97 /DNA_ID=CAMNT_0012397285 /DNA_START=214 /DNA_END=503 /DNA_ORIENTATION=-